MRSMNYLPFVTTWVHLRFLEGSVLLILLVSVVVLCFVHLGHVSYVPNVICVSQLSIFYCLFVFCNDYCISMYYPWKRWYEIYIMQMSYISVLLIYLPSQFVLLETRIFRIFISINVRYLTELLYSIPWVVLTMHFSAMHWHIINDNPVNK